MDLVHPFRITQTNAKLMSTNRKKIKHMSAQLTSKCAKDAISQKDKTYKTIKKIKSFFMKSGQDIYFFNQKFDNDVN